MTQWPTLVVFFSCLALSFVSSLVLASGLDKIGARLSFSAGLLGFVTALGADAPEIASAVSALVGGHRDLGLGVVLGSNVFNLAALLGFSAVLAGRVTVGRRGMLFDGGVAVLVTLIGAGLILGALPAWLALVGMALLLVPYVAVSALRPARVERLTLLPRAARDFLGRAVVQAHADARKDHTPPQASWTDALSVVPALVSIVVASIGMVHAAVDLAARWRWPHAVVGTLVLATLTGIPNVLAAVRLALKGRGSAVVSEALNSNSLNLLAGVALPAVVLGLGVASSSAVLALGWLVGMTVLAVGLACYREGLSRLGGASLLLLYLGFVVAILFWQA